MRCSPALARVGDNGAYANAPVLARCSAGKGTFGLRRAFGAHAVRDLSIVTRRAPPEQIATHRLRHDAGYAGYVKARIFEQG